jgi:Protein of unknown function (DUF3108)
MKRLLITSLFSVMLISSSAGDDFCNISNTTFVSGERITFKVFYNVVGFFIDAGSAQFSINKERLNNKIVYHVIGDGFSNPSYDWVFKVRDRYESYIDTTSLKPYKFIRNVEEGGYKKYENVTFNHEAGTAVSTRGTFSVPSCVQDVLSTIYYARNIDYNKYKPGDKIPFSLFLDDEVTNLFIRFVGRETIKTKYGKFNAILIKPLLVKGTIFEGGEKMNVWVSDDANHIPLRIESPISVGSVKVDMMGYANLRYPLSSKMSVKF